MLDTTAHPNTQVMLEAWRRMADAGAATAPQSAAGDPTALIGNIFVLRAHPDRKWLFRTAGQALSAHFGKALCDEDFLELWLGADRGLAGSTLDSVCALGSPALIRARGETLTGRILPVEIALAPLTDCGSNGRRVLGYYQPLGGEAMVGARPLWRHTICEVIAPKRPIGRPHLRLVSSQD